MIVHMWRQLMIHGSGVIVLSAWHFVVELINSMLDGDCGLTMIFDVLIFLIAAIKCDVIFKQIPEQIFLQFTQIK